MPAYDSFGNQVSYAGNVFTLAGPTNPGISNGGSGSIGTTYTNALPVNYLRTGFLIQNTHASQSLTVAFGASGQEIPQIVLLSGQKVTNADIGNFLGEIRVKGSGASTTFVANDYVQNLAVDPHSATVIARIIAGGWNLNTIQQSLLDTKIKNIKAAINNGVYSSSTTFPFGAYWKSYLSVDTSGTSTQVWNLGTLGATVDGTMTNGNASNMVVTQANGRKTFQGTSASSRFIASGYAADVSQPLFMMALVNRTAAAQQTLMEALTKISILPYLSASTKAGVAYQGGTNIGFTNDVTNGTWASLATNTTTSTYAQYRNGAEKVNSTVTLTGTGVFSAMTLGGSNYLNSPADDFILATSTFTDAQILALHTYLISDVS